MMDKGSPAGCFFRVPPYPNAGPIRTAAETTPSGPMSDEQLDKLMQLAARSRIGGTYWGEQPELPSKPYALVRIGDDGERAEILRSLSRGLSVLVWLDSPPRHSAHFGTAQAVTGCCDPWHLVGGAEQVYVDADDELCLVAALARVPVTGVGNGRFKGLEPGAGHPANLRRAFRLAVESTRWLSPFSGNPVSPFEAADLCGFWRSLIDRNRALSGAIGFARWKRATVAPLLWSGVDPVRFISRPPDRPAAGAYAIWKSRVSSKRFAAMERQGHRLVEVEDGFIRSVGLGADCVPPLSIVVDELGIYFDPSRESDLERLLEHGPISTDMVERAARLRRAIVELGIEKYGVGGSGPNGSTAERGSILVPGQVEDDRSVISGGGEVQTNLELLRRVRARHPDAIILYKPHPDVEAGHRRGRIPEDSCRALADRVVRNRPITELFAEVEEVHVNTSLAGFEALLRGKSVTTYGVPFYAGWGLTRDLGSVPSRRTAKRSLDELIAAALLMYPRYLDPVTGLPCPPEILIERISQSPRFQRRDPVVPLRRLQGRIRRIISSVWSG